MDAVSMAAVGSASVASSSNQTTVLEKSEIRVAPRMKAALTALLEALDYAHDADTSAWDFAIEISTLRRLKLSNSDLRWLVVRGLVEHAVEITLGGDSQRSFRHPARLVFSKKTCFVLTSAGAELARGFSRRAVVRTVSDGRAPSEPPALAIVNPPSTSLVPKWDRDRLELRVGSTVVKRFKIPSVQQEAILAALEEKGWPGRIENPLGAAQGDAARGMQQAIQSLNMNQKQPLIRFLEDAGGQAVLWEFTGDHAIAAEE